MRNKTQLRYSLITFFLIPLLLCSLANGATTTEKGEQLYGANCAKCHGRNGEGFRKLYPPLQNSIFLQKEIPRLPCIIRYGMKGEISVGGSIFNQVMPGNSRLSSEDMTHIIIYMQKIWNHPDSKLTVEKWLKNCN